VVFGLGEEGVDKFEEVASLTAATSWKNHAAPLEFEKLVGEESRAEPDDSSGMGEGQKRRYGKLITCGLKRQV
jgi:hypothetical protein